MRQGQQKRMRGRNRNTKGPNPLSRTYESNGPDVKVRGTPAHIAEKYVQLARDAQSSGDPILAESYLQHAEHYFRIIAAAQPQFAGQQGFAQQDEDDDGDESEFDGPIPSMPQGFASQLNQNDEQPRFQPRERGFGERERNFGDRQPYNGERQGFADRQPFNADRNEGDAPQNERFRDRGPRFNNDRGDRGPREDRQPREERVMRDDRPPRDDRPLRDDRPPRDDRPMRDDRPPREDRQPREERVMRDDRPVRDDRPPREERPHRDDRPPRAERTFEAAPSVPRVETEGAEGDQPRGFTPRGGRRDRRFGGERPFQERTQGERPTYHDRSFAQASQPVVPLDQPQPDVGDDRALSTLPSFITGAPVIATPVPAPAPAAAAPSAPAAAPAAPEAAAPEAAAPAEPTEGEGEARFPLRTRRRRTTKRASTEATPTDSETENAGD